MLYQKYALMFYFQKLFNPYFKIFYFIQRIKSVSEKSILPFFLEKEVNNLAWGRNNAFKI